MRAKGKSEVPKLGEERRVGRRNFPRKIRQRRRARLQLTRQAEASRSGPAEGGWQEKLKLSGTASVQRCRPVEGARSRDGWWGYAKRLKLQTLTAVQHGAGKRRRRRPPSPPQAASPMALSAGPSKRMLPVRGWHKTDPFQRSRSLRSGNWREACSPVASCRRLSRCGPRSAAWPTRNAGALTARGPTPQTRMVPRRARGCTRRRMANPARASHAEARSRRRKRSGASPSAASPRVASRARSGPPRQDPRPRSPPARRRGRGSPPAGWRSRAASSTACCRAARYRSGPPRWARGPRLHPTHRAPGPRHHPTI